MLAQPMQALAATTSRISVAILSFNRRDELRSTLTELQRTPTLWREIIVADNASRDGTAEMVCAEFPSVRLLRTGGNIGIAGSNLAYEAASGDWILSLDDDSHPAPESLSDVFAAIDLSCDAAAIAISIRREWRSPSTAAPVRPLEDAHGFSSAGVLFNKRALTAIGPYDPELFLFTNELHWTARALIAGWSLAKSDTACVVHRSAPLNRSSARHAYYYTRNTLLFLLRYSPAEQLQPLFARYVQRTAACSILHRTTTYVRAVRDALALHRRAPERRTPLTPTQLHAISPDWRAGFSYLG